MKKTFTKSLALLLAVLMLMTAMPMGVFAAGTCTHWETLVTTGKKAATENADGNIAYAYCSNCQKYFAIGTSGPDFSKELDPDELVLHFFPADKDYNLALPGCKDKKKSDATCQTGNIYYKKCKHCNTWSDTLTFEDKERADHKPADEWTVPTGADCTVQGFTKKILCTVCAQSVYEERVPKGEHAEVPMDDIAATCQKEGHRAGMYCTNCCKYLQGGETISKTAHDIKTIPGRERVEATCTEPGTEEVKICTMCRGEETIVGGKIVNGNIVANVIPKLGHKIEDVEKRTRTCMQDGYNMNARICTRCGLSLSPAGAVVLDKAPGKHHPVKVLERAATTSSRGWVEHFVCDNYNGDGKQCGQLFLQQKATDGKPAVDPNTHEPILKEATEAEVYTKPKNHTHKEYKDTTLSKDGDCETDGRLVIKCEICGETIKDEKIVATGHDWKEVISDGTTCIKSGIKCEKCTKCGAERNRQPVIGDHKWKLEKPADCTKGGDAIYKCEVCGTEKKESVAKRDAHEDKDDNGVCEVCNTKFCSCICHNHAWYSKILMFFVQVWWQFLGIRQNCACGKVHYVKNASPDVPSVVG